ncbi:succinate dehydrogenase, hydrophobic membrane anchor protein [Denitromonas sp.]|uniref:succinate dehydrogenase, hydrophobic membrane anchor protein n=1 Tax=Denitromonas sp. TaxID=2734609 RepID=UPI003A845A1A
MVRLFSGQRAWVAQRFTAVVLLAAVLAGVAWLLLGTPLDYARWHALVTTPVGAVLTVLVFVMLAVHGWVGARDIVLDYVQPRGLRLALLGAILLVLAATLIRVVLVLATHGAA